MSANGIVGTTVGLRGVVTAGYDRLVGAPAGIGPDSGPGALLAAGAEAAAGSAVMSAGTGAHQNIVNGVQEGLKGAGRANS
jgi:hypothetical protein